jgi:sugar (pentulose or hexulose) kinase
VLRQFFTDTELAELSAGIRPDRAGCLDYYPLPRPGERFPIADPGLRPRLTPRPHDSRRFLQGLFEGIARIEALGYRRLTELGAPVPARVLSSGGGSRNPVWSAIRQRILRRPVVPARHDQAAYGAALLALRGSAESGG